VNPRPKKFLAAFVGAVAAITMVGAGSAAAKTPPPKPPIAAEAAADKGAPKGTPADIGPAPRSFKPRK
jgi:hypothetical protein